MDKKSFPKSEIFQPINFTQDLDLGIFFSVVMPLLEVVLQTILYQLNKRIANDDTIHKVKTGIRECIIFLRVRCGVC